MSRAGCGGGVDVDNKLPYIQIGYDMGIAPSGADFQAIPWDHTPPGQVFEIYDPLFDGTMPPGPGNPGNVFPHFYYDTATDTLTIKTGGLYQSNLIVDYQGVINANPHGPPPGNAYNRMAAIGPPTGPTAPSWANFADPDLLLPAGVFQTVLRGYTWLSKAVNSTPLVMDGRRYNPGDQFKAFYFQDSGVTFARFSMQASWTVYCLSDAGASGYHDA